MSKLEFDRYLLDNFDYGDRPPKGSNAYEDAYFVWKWKQRASKTLFGIVFGAVIFLLTFGLDPFRSDDEPCRYVKIDTGVYDYVCREPAP